MSTHSDRFDLHVSVDAEQSGALLCASVDLFIARDTHSDEEVHLFCELCINLLPDSTPKHCRYAAERLADRGDAPAKLIRALAYGPTETAEPIILRSPVLNAADLLRIMSQDGASTRLVTQRVANSAISDPCWFFQSSPIECGAR